MKNTSVSYRDLGNMDFQEAWDLQEKILKETVAIKTYNRDHPETEKQTDNFLFFVEHPHVYTLGKSGKMDHLLLNEEQLKEKSISFYKINRGGDITYHGPGQIVGYPVLDLENFKPDIHWYLRNLEEAAILTIAEYGITGDRIQGLTGVWVGKDSPDPRKIMAIGVRCSRWVTMHGFAFNVNTDLAYFKDIIPCGIDDKGVTSMEKELGRKLDMNEVKEKMKKNLAITLGLSLTF